jgi:glutathione synthase/RimK-type ligase-like ATP-grasp enzyme
VILLWGLPDEEPMALVRRELSARDADVVLLDQHRYADVAGSLQVSEQATVAGSLTIGDRTVGVDELTGMYMRPYELPEQHGAPVTPAQAASVDALLSVLFEVVPETVAVINRPSAMASNDSKPAQLVPIEASGFSVPATVVTNDAEQLADFRERHGSVVYKSTSGIRSVANLIDAHATLDGRLDRLGTCATQFQEFIPGDDYRVHVVGADVFAARIECDAVDYRYAGMTGHSRSMTAATLPDDVAERAVRLTASLGLLVAGVDLRLTPSGQWYCFEVNTSPAFSWFESYTGQPIGETIARLLMG